MAQQTINVGAAPNDGTGTPLRTAFQYTNANFTELYTALGGGAGLPGATTQVIFNDGGTNLAGDAGLTYNKATDALTVGGLLTAGSGSITGDLTVATSSLKVTGGNVFIGATSQAFGEKFQVYGNYAVFNDASYAGFIGRGSAIGTATASDFAIRSSNALVFLTGGANERVRLDSSGNLGLGVTPSAWGGGFTGLQVRYLSLASNNNSDSRIYSGAVYGVSGETYIVTGLGVTKYQAGNGSHSWYNAAAGTAGNAITFTQAMTLDASGNLLVGTTSTTGSASNNTKSVGGLFSTVNGSLGSSTASGVAATLFTMPNEATFLVSVYITGTGAPANYNAVSIVKVSSGVATISSVSTALNLTISMSGLNVQATQTSGVNQFFAYSAIRIS